MQISALLPVLAFLGTVAVDALPARSQQQQHRRALGFSKRANKVCRPRSTASAAPAAPSPSATHGDVEAHVSVSSAIPSVYPTQAATSDSPAPAPSSEAPAPSSEAPAPSSSPAPAPSTGGGSSNNGANAASLTPNGKKAGVSAGNNLAALGDKIGWWYNWAPTEDYAHSDVAEFIPMLWGGGSTDGTDASRLAAFQGIQGAPKYIIGMEEPDCPADGMSSGMTVDATADLWNRMMVPKGNEGSLLVSPSMCKQLAENGWLKEFQGKISRDFDIINLHINKNNIQGVKDSLDYYWNTYKKPIWVTEFACVDDSSAFIPCTDQGQINNHIQQVVDLFEQDERVYAYAYSNGWGLGDVWPMWKSDGSLSESGQTYLNAISKYH